MTSTNITNFPGKVAIGSNVFIDDTASNKLVITGSISTTGTLSGDGSGIDNIQTSNVIGLTDNVTRIGTLEADLTDNVTRIGTLEADLTDNVTRIGTLEVDLTDNVTRIGTLEADLSDNSSRITNIESGDITITGKKTFQDEVTFESNIRVQGDLLVANTVNMVVSDPIMELGSNNLNTGDLGIVMTRHGATNSNVAVFYDESEDVLKLGYTLNGANDTAIELDSNTLAVSIQGNVEVGTANLFVDTTTGYVGIGTTNPGFSLDVHGTANVGALTATSISGPLSGNASTATALQTARNINGVSFNGSANITVNGLNYNVNDVWLKEQGGNAHFKQYGNTRQMAFRTDGTSEYASGVGGYPFVWMYGGDAASNRRMLLNTSGQLWCSDYGWLHDKFVSRNSATSQTFTDNNSNATFTGHTIDFNGSGTQTNTANRTHRALLIDYDTSTSGGTTTTNERNYNYAMHSDMRHSGTGDQYVFYNHYLYTRSDHTSGTCSLMRGIQNSVVSSGTGINTEMHGINTYVIKDNGSTEATSTMYGTKTEVEVDAGTVTNAFAYHAHIDRDAGTLTNGYLYYGNYAGTVGTKWGIYLSGESKNYFSGDVGIGVTNPLNSLVVNGKTTIGTGASTTNSQYHDGTLNVIGGGTRAILRVENNNGIGDPTIILGEGGGFTENTVPTIKKIAGTNNLSIMTAGNVGINTTTPGYELDVNGDIRGGCPVYFAAYNTNGTSPGNTVIWDELWISRGGGYDTSTGIFTAPIAGIYKFYYTLRQAGGATSGLWARVQLNGSDISNTYGAIYLSTTRDQAGSTVLLNLNVGDEISVKVYNYDMASVYNSFVGEYFSSL